MIKILLFANLQESAGTDALELGIERSTIKEIKTVLQENYRLPELDHVMTAVNEEYAWDDSAVKSGDTVAFIPPVSGG